MEKLAGNDIFEVDKVIRDPDELKELLNQYIYQFDNFTPEEFNTIRTANEVENYSIYFRGHSKVNYRLESTLERYVKSSFSKRINLEKDYIKLKDHYLAYCKDKLLNISLDGYIILPSDLSEIELWSFGQHYQLKSPLLDWSKSFHIALYFAFENKEEEDDAQDEDKKYRVIYILTDSLFSDKKIVFEPTRKIGNRIINQKGVFINKSSFELENLSKTGIISIKKILISSDLRKEILNYLASINIDSSTIYPDLFGKVKNCERGIDNAIAKINLESQE
ncbi:hypothetical protein BKG94_08600 [Rodentibacter ratti]|uniref:FRG domain-containing protein n=1 Tax=Rodentibacter ratti TaxID=1906745 RepID=UPI00098475C2|nr:FRG domain-containing protein [Rodentibacter ratti]OOF87869.1 hypothetical protein BKG94_08600 [Rodentibacter ratti]